MRERRGLNLRNSVHSGILFTWKGKNDTYIGACICTCMYMDNTCLYMDYTCWCMDISR